MEVPLQTGIYTYDPEIPLLTYEGTAITLDEIQNKNQFLLIDTVQKVGQKIEQGVPRLFKLIFPRSIGISSNKIDTDSAFLIKQFSNSLIQASKDKNAIDV
jgi:tetrahydromethanopterin S-methyltransferase subunit G